MSTVNQSNIIADMHTHSEHSHDSICPIKDMAQNQINNGTKIFAVTDHCDIEYFETQDLKKKIGDSVSDAQKHNAEIDGVEILAGVEIGEAFWHSDVARKIVSDNNYDVIIGSVHAVQFENYTMPYSTIDFGKLGKEMSAEYLDKYFDDLAFMMEQAISLAGLKSTVTFFGLTKPMDTISVKPFELFKKEIVLKASFINPYTQKRALDLISSKKIDVESMIYKIADFEELPEILGDAKLRVQGKFIIKS